MNAPLADLDDLLSESLTLSAARKAQIQGRKLSVEQSAVLESNKLALEVAMWTKQKAYAHIVLTSCKCGNHYRDFRGWYHYETQVRGSGRRLVHREDNGGLEPAVYCTETVLEQCSECLPAMPKAWIVNCDLLGMLGEGQVIASNASEEEVEEEVITPLREVDLPPINEDFDQLITDYNLEGFFSHAASA